MRNYFGQPRVSEIDCPVCGNRTTIRQSGTHRYIATHIEVIAGSPETCVGSRTAVSPEVK